MRAGRISIAAVIAAFLMPLALFLRTFSASPLPKPATYMGPAPSTTPPEEMAVIALVTGVNHRVAAYGYRGGSLFERRDFSMAGALVKHPRGDLLIDTGFGRNIAEQFYGRWKESRCAKSAPGSSGDQPTLMPRPIAKTCDG